MQGGGEGRYWDEFGHVERLSSDFKVIVPDLRAHGHSDTPLDRDFSDHDILNYWTSLGAPFSDDSKKRIGDFDQQVLMEIVKDRLDRTERLRNLRIPFLMICGTNDWRFEDMKRFATTDARYEFVTVEGLDHLQTWLRSDLVLPAIQGFLRAAHAG